VGLVAHVLDPPPPDDVRSAPPPRRPLRIDASKAIGPVVHEIWSSTRLSTRLVCAPLPEDAQRISFCDSLAGVSFCGPSRFVDPVEDGASHDGSHDGRRWRECDVGCRIPIKKRSASRGGK